MSINNKKRIGIFDLEATATDCSGFIVGYGLMDEDGSFKHRFLDGKTVDAGEKDLLIFLREDLSKYSVIIGHYIRRYDFPLIISRCLLRNVNPLGLLQIRKIDTWEIAQNFLLMPSYHNTLEDLCRFFGITKNISLQGSDMPSLYMRAVQGDKTSLNTIAEHCRDDVTATFHLYNKLKILIGQEPIKY